MISAFTKHVNCTIFGTNLGRKVLLDPRQQGFYHTNVLTKQLRIAYDVYKSGTAYLGLEIHSDPYAWRRLVCILSRL